MTSHSYTRTPIWAPNDGIIVRTRCFTGHTEISQFDCPILVRKYIGTFDISMYHSLVVQVYQTFQGLGDIHGYQILWELAEFLGYVM